MPRRSSIQQLPADILADLHELLRDPAVTQLQAAQRINARLIDLGSDQRVSKSAVNRYSIRMEEVGKKIQQSRQIADMWIGRLGHQPQGEVGKLLNEFTRTIAFDTALSLSEESEPVPPKLLKELALAVKHLEEAASVNMKREQEIRRAAAEEAASVAEKEARAQGLSQAGVAEIKRKILGAKA